MNRVNSGDRFAGRDERFGSCSFVVGVRVVPLTVYGLSGFGDRRQR
jgi:hypothetical protein